MKRERVGVKLVLAVLAFGGVESESFRAGFIARLILGRVDGCMDYVYRDHLTVGQGRYDTR